MDGFKGTKTEMLAEDRYYEFVREERFFCTILAHLLMQDGSNMKSFLDFVGEKINDRSTVQAVDARDAEIYLEFSFLRDRWDDLAKDNRAKRALIMTMLARVPELQSHGIPEFPESVSDFNAFFIGPAGLKFTRNIASPGRWRVAALAERFGQDQEVFLGFCKFKWSFNIKPDIVIVVRGSKPLSIEAKLESGEGRYPDSTGERTIFNRLFGQHQGYVGQIELQQFMFSVMLDEPCDSLFLTRNPGTGARIAWQQVFERLDVGTSIGFVRKLIEENRHLKPTRASGRG